MHSDPVRPYLAGAFLTNLLLGLLLRKLNPLHVVGYLLASVILGAMGKQAASKLSMKTNI